MKYKPKILNRRPDPSQFLAKGGGGDDDEGANASDKGDEEEGDMDYEGSTQELLANVDCLLTTDTGEGSSGTQVRQYAASEGIKTVMGFFGTQINLVTPCAPPIVSLDQNRIFIPEKLLRALRTISSIRIKH